MMYHAMCPLSFPPPSKEKIITELIRKKNKDGLDPQNLLLSCLRCSHFILLFTFGIMFLNIDKIFLL